MGYFFKRQTPEFISDNKWILNRKDFVPAYLKTYETDKHIFEYKVGKAMSVLKNCEVCPRDCHIDRLANKTAVCRTGRYAYVASAFPHFGEEDCLRGWQGSGTIFFSFCNLKCVFCQNFDISWEGNGQILKPAELAKVIIHLQEKGCHNINFVTPEHVVPQIMEAIPLAIEMGLTLPIVYNTSAYDSLHSLDLMDGIVDVYMPDFKFWDNELSFLYMAARNYPEVARTAIKKMHDQVGDLKFDENGLALRGILLRHLVMPNRVASTREICRFISDQISKDTYINIMDQYRPDGRVLKKPEKYEDITRPTSTKEYHEAVKVARQEGLYRIDTR
jgi:putative pyruvate formate lyase activating enzyme